MIKGKGRATSIILSIVLLSLALASHYNLLDLGLLFGMILLLATYLSTIFIKSNYNTLRTKSLEESELVKDLQRKVDRLEEERKLQKRSLIKNSKLMMQAATKIEDEKQRANAIIESATDGIMTTDMHGGINSANYACEQMLGYKISDLCTMNICDIVQGGLDALFSVADRTVKLNWSVVGKRQNGTQLELELGISKSRLLGKENYIVILRDVSERKMLEARLLQAQKLESIGQLASGIAHEINTPIQFIGDNLQFVQKSISDIITIIMEYENLSHKSELRESKQISEHLDLINKRAQDIDLEFVLDELPGALKQSREGVDRVVQIVKAMKSFTYRGSDEKALMDLNEAIETSLVLARNEWKDVAIIDCKLDPNLPSITACRGELSQVILNLLVNAAHAISDRKKRDKTAEGVIKIETALDGHSILMKVIDSGIGIPEEIKGMIFNPFFTTKEVGRGSGQGLTLSYAIVVGKHGGTISFESEYGKGTTFMVRLPLSESSNDNPKNQSTSLESSDVLGRTLN